MAQPRPETLFLKISGITKKQPRENGGHFGPLQLHQKCTKKQMLSDLNYLNVS